MSGAGKSRVGRLVAERLRWRFVDTDAEIERCTGRAVPEIFATAPSGARLPYITTRWLSFLIGSLSGRTMY